MQASLLAHVREEEAQKAIDAAFENRFSGASLDDMFLEAQMSLDSADEYLTQQSCFREN